jgi:hypothetical protein
VFVIRLGWGWAGGRGIEGMQAVGSGIGGTQGRRSARRGAARPPPRGAHSGSAAPTRALPRRPPAPASAAPCG